jgi:hypothetical protein
LPAIERRRARLWKRGGFAAEGSGWALLWRLGCSYRHNMDEMGGLGKWVGEEDVSSHPFIEFQRPSKRERERNMGHVSKSRPAPHITPRT